MLKYDQYGRLIIMRQHEISKRKKLKQKRRESSKSQVEKNINENSNVREDRRGTIPFLHTLW